MNRHRASPRRVRGSGPRLRSGGVLIEFSISILALWLIAAATLDLGRAFAAAHVLQGAARAATRELALAEQAWDDGFDVALSQIYDPDFLVIDADCLAEEAAGFSRTPGAHLGGLLEARGLTLNSMLRPLMISERLSLGGRDWHLLRYPGALLSTTDVDDPWSCARTGFTVAVPEIDRAASRIDLHAVVEEGVPGSYGLDGSPGATIPAGTASIRLRYPFQAVGLTGWRLESGVHRPISSDEADGFTVGSLPTDASLVSELDARQADGTLQAYAVGEAGRTIPVYGGRLGLGFQNVLARSVRPYRRVITAQAMAPREVIAPGT